MKNGMTTGIVIKMNHAREIPASTSRRIQPEMKTANETSGKMKIKSGSSFWMTLFGMKLRRIKESPMWAANQPLPTGEDQSSALKSFLGVFGLLLIDSSFEIIGTWIGFDLIGHLFEGDLRFEVVHSPNGIEVELCTESPVDISRQDNLVELISALH